jgi:hypothetical protein
MEDKQRRAMFAKGANFSRGITKAQILAGGRDDDKILIDEIHHGQMVGNQGKRFASPYPYAKNPADLADYVKGEKKKFPNYDFEVVHKEPFKDYHWKAEQYNYNNIRQGDLRNILAKDASQIRIMNRAKATSEDKKRNPHRVWAITAKGMFERTSALKRWLDKDGYKSGVKTAIFSHGMGTRNDDPNSKYRYDNDSSTRTPQIQNIEAIVYWEDNATSEQKKATQAVLSKYFDMDLNAEHSTVATFADADVRLTKDWEEKLKWKADDQDTYGGKVDSWR